MNLTTPQRECLERAKETLGEHFDASVIVVMVADDHGHEAHWVARSGGYAIALGLLTVAQLRLNDDWGRSQSQDDDDD
jgi:hypothetical protein